MKIVVISTTTHSKNSTSKMVLEELMNQFREKDHDVDYIDADQLHIVKNLSCYSDGGSNCAHPEAGKYRCWAYKLSQENPSEYGGKDEMSVIYDALEWCDLVVWGTSVRWGSHSALMQKIIERMNTLENRQVVYGEDNPLKDKKCGVVVTGQHYKAQQVADHLITQFGWFGFSVDQSYVFTWQKSQDIHLEQETNNNGTLRNYLKSEEGKGQLKTLVDYLS